MPRLLNANNSELEDNLPYVRSVENKTDIGNDKTKKPGNFKIIIFSASVKGKPNSTIFLIKSNITPTESETTVNAESANKRGGTNWPNNHLSIKGISRRK